MTRSSSLDLGREHPWEVRIELLRCSSLARDTPVDMLDAPRNRAMQANNKTSPK